MTIITRKEFAELSKVHEPTCISIYIPTHRSGEEVLQKKDPLALKNQIKATAEKLEAREYSGDQVDDALRPARELLEDTEFWRHQSDGLALFISDGNFRKYTLPISFEPGNYVGNSFYLKPIMPMFTGDGRYFILSLGLEDVKFYEGTRHSITRIEVKDLTPARLQETVGYDYEETFLQFRSQQEGAGHAIFHGHGGGDADRKDEILRYFRAVNDGLMTILHDEQQPMLVASLDYFFPIYQEVNTYNHLLGEPLPGNPADEDMLSLHEKTWEIMEPHFDRDRQEKAGLYRQFRGTERAGSDLGDILQAAQNGRVEALFIEGQKDVWGVYHREKQEVERHDRNRESSVSLYNLAAIETFLKGGDVYLLEKEDLPDQHTEICALYRY